MKEKELFLEALSTLFWSWGSEPPAEVIWGANELIDWYEKEYNVKINERFTEDIDLLAEQYDKVIKELKSK